MNIEPTVHSPLISAAPAAPVSPRGGDGGASRAAGDARGAPRAADDARAPSTPASSAASTASEHDVLEVGPASQEEPPRAASWASRRRWAALKTVGVGALGGATLGVKELGESALFGNARLRDAAKTLGGFGVFISGHAATAARTLAPAVLPSTLTHLGELASFRLAAVVGLIAGVPAGGRRYFAQWQPGTPWPSGCEALPPPAPPPPGDCPDDWLSGLQGVSEAPLVAATYLLWGTVAGAALAGLALFTPARAQLARLPGLDHTVVVAVVTATAGLLPLFAAQRARELSV